MSRPKGQRVLNLTESPNSSSKTVLPSFRFNCTCIFICILPSTEHGQSGGLLPVSTGKTMSHCFWVHVVSMVADVQHLFTLRRPRVPLLRRLATSSSRYSERGMSPPPHWGEAARCVLQVLTFCLVYTFNTFSCIPSLPLGVFTAQKLSSFASCSQSFPCCLPGFMSYSKKALYFLLVLSWFPFLFWDFLSLFGIYLEYGTR